MEGWRNWNLFEGFLRKSWSVWVVYLFFVKVENKFQILHSSTFYTFDEGFWLMNSMIMEEWRIWNLFSTLTKKSLEIQTIQLFQWKLADKFQFLHSAIRQGLRPHHTATHEHTHLFKSPFASSESPAPVPLPARWGFRCWKNENQKRNKIDFNRLRFINLKR